MLTSAKELAGQQYTANREMISNYLRLHLIGTSWTKLLKESARALFTKTGTVVLVKFSDGSAALFQFAVGTSSAYAFVLIDGSIIVNGQPYTLGGAPSGTIYHGTIKNGAINNGVEIGGTVQKCRQYQIKTSTGDVYSGTVCWYYHA